MPDYTLEHAHGGRVAGVDEVGRGPLAGPVVAAAVMFPGSVPGVLADRLDDSKKLKPALRARLYDVLLASPDVLIGVGAASVAEIGQYNILRTSWLAMQRAVGRLPRSPEFILVDGNAAPDFGCPAQCVVGGDGISLSIAAASVVAKVIRDRLMARLARRWPAYGWERNAGYGTAIHRAGLLAQGASPHHRAAFGTVRRILQASVSPSSPPSAEQPSC
ncbi:ribonuclease HII [Komagataeibacter rhaeticus]|uniref:ribonuclease HII n=1 Tax=Komagataeibacter rhaeticus TaxID=215221 RepID=UPI0004DA3205|nr:ribonuclease HII [Komagataeibacter rhaeticus]KDU95764.1 ribonuclease HII [Komagataeibacter rhaeticus AF1]MBL7239990.1 ribonuclease HII [Komagataeibacter rhaeticus]PYD54631.1 ribonuclease HII [Komagataeibacter rhaeticus]GBQ15989.1 ribonuclease HII [Komagataeibacter rhaeticus DSM 16663]